MEGRKAESREEKKGFIIETRRNAGGYYHTLISIEGGLASKNSSRVVEDIQNLAEKVWAEQFCAGSLGRVEIQVVYKKPYEPIAPL